MKKKLFIDIETDFGTDKKGRFGPKRLLNVGLVSSDKKVREEYFIWQDESKLLYPDNVDMKYVTILQLWRTKSYTPVVEVLERIYALSKEYQLCGWNIKGFDIPVLQQYFKRYKFGEFNPDCWDGYFAIREYVKTRKQLARILLKFNGGEKKGMLTAETMFKYLTGCSGYKENHTGLYDAEDEKHLTSLLVQRYGKALIELG